MRSLSSASYSWLQTLTVAAMTALPIAVAQASPADLSSGWRINANGYVSDVVVQQSSNGTLSGRIFGDPLSGFYAPGERVGVWLRGSPTQPMQAFVGSASPDGTAFGGRFYGLNASTSGANAQRNIFAFSALRTTPGQQVNINNPSIPAATSGPASVAGSLALDANSYKGQLVINQAPDGTLSGTIFGDRLSGLYSAGSGTVAFLRFSGTQPAQLYVGSATPQGLRGEFYALTAAAGASAQKMSATWTAQATAAAGSGTAVPLLSRVPPGGFTQAQTTANTAPSGTNRILAAGTLSTDGPKSQTGNLIRVQAFRANQGALQSITTEEYKDRVETEVRKLEDLILLGSDPNIYPGAILQGRNYASGNFIPVTIPRSPGIIYIDGLNLPAGAPRRRTVTTVSPSEVDSAIADILGKGAAGTAANIDFKSSATNSSSKLFFDLGIDVRYGPVSVKGQLTTNTNTQSNYAYMLFRQVYYRVHFEGPSSPVAFFKDGDNFQDPLGQISPGNPPLYVSTVAYGRIVLLRIEGENSSSDLAAALNGAYSGGVNVKVDATLKVNDVLDKSRVSYMVFGGDAAASLKPIEASPGQMAQAVRSFLAAERAAVYSKSSPGVPVAYTLKYLKDDAPAVMAFSTGPYNKQDIVNASLPELWSTRQQCSMVFADPQDGDGNHVEIRFDWNSPSVPEGQVRLNLLAAPGITWYKEVALKGGNATLVNLNTQDGRTSSTATVPAPLLKSQQVRFVLTKAKDFGNWRPVANILSGLEYIPPKTNVTFEWRKDRGNISDPHQFPPNINKQCKF